jgi:hypothetical protein
LIWARPMNKSFEVIDPSEIEHLGRQPLLSLQILGVEAQIASEVLAGQEHAEDVDLTDVLELEKEGIYRSALEDCVNAFKLMRAIRG